MYHSLFLPQDNIGNEMFDFSAFFPQLKLCKQIDWERFNEIISSLELAIGPVLSIWHNQLSRRLKVLGTGISSYHELREGRIYEGGGIVTSYK